MDMRLFTGLVIKLFLAFCFLFSFPASSNSSSLTLPFFECNIFPSSQDNLSFFQTRDECLAYIQSKSPLSSQCTSSPFWDVYIARCKGPYPEDRLGYNSVIHTCPSGFISHGSSCTKIPTCNADQILNPETNTCDARCTAPDVWDPVTNQCITPKNRCDILGERKPVVETDWRQSTLGSSFVGKHACMPSGCVITGTKDVGCLSDSDRCYGDAKYTGTECTYTEGVTSGWCSDETCSDQSPVEPVPDPENPNPEPPSPNPDPTPGDNLTPPNPDTSADPNNPNLDEETNKGVVNELNTANKQLENIQKTLEVTLDEITTQNKQIDKANDKIILGIQNLTQAVNDKPVGGGGGGSGGEGEGEGSSVSGASCDAFECKGDAVVCYIAKKQWEEACGVEKAKRDDLPKITGSIDKIITDHPLDDLNAGTLNVDSVMNKYTNGGGLTVSKACPAPDVVTTSLGSFTLNYSPFCDLAKVFHFFLVSLALVGSALLIAKYGL
ncbi:virulence factor TspB C-terminal domain-related protein [Vibrio cholerae]|uniref:virulence factor TspB C-terminal domain-related protein n=1 Tax=Vibrio cholerae TaxID=666 RepID=UPI000E0A4AB8|nr:virulence factor TspB C-terminal domain-related protein [Vibrio cholerae]